MGRVACSFGFFDASVDMVRYYNIVSVDRNQRQNERQKGQDLCSNIFDFEKTSNQRIRNDDPVARSYSMKRR